MYGFCGTSLEHCVNKVGSFGPNYPNSQTSPQVMQPTTPQVAQPTPTGVQQTTPLAPQVGTGAVGGRPNSPPTAATATGASEGTVGQASQVPLQAMP
ncbi:predicted protein, partial [Thalassiosira pseudonana CCMP1335]